MVFFVLPVITIGHKSLIMPTVKPGSFFLFFDKWPSLKSLPLKGLRPRRAPFLFVCLLKLNIGEQKEKYFCAAITHIIYEKNKKYVYNPGYELAGL